MITPVSHVQSQTTLRRRRLLPVEGLVLVNDGDAVQSTDHVARADLDVRHLILDAARSLGISADQANPLIQRAVGEEVEEGTILAGRRGIGSRQLRAPANGRVVAINGAQILLQTSSESSILQARVPGEIIDIEPGRGVTIEIVCAWVQGIWGNHGLGDGVLQIVGSEPNQHLTADLIDISQRGVILVAGYCDERQVLELAAQVPIRGLVLGSLTTRLFPVAQRQPYPIITLEGFGQVPMNSVAFDLLANHDGDKATLNAQAVNPENGDRPEVIIPVKEANQSRPPETVQPFRVGQTVRVLAGLGKSRVGKITGLLPPSTVYPSGLRAPGALVAFPDQGEGRHPLANLELIV
ncbi:MAG TPA: hypothetical protein VI703_04165 [Anaerolineales bacterium]|jgi:hypothetical protein|nr:hypothetical protein [Anaerolineales bacterium]